MMITYNHARFIAQAIESVLAQRTPFGVELVIGEDCSTDGTRAILLDYAERHPGAIRLLLPERNIGMIENARRTREACRGEFVAFLEGDDFWTHPDKLRRQVEWLDGHPDSPLCFHDTVVLTEATGQTAPDPCTPRASGLVPIDAVIRANPIPTCSVVCRRAALPPLPSSFFQLPGQDWPLWVLLLRSGPAGYLHESWGCYRLHGGGIWSSQPASKRLRSNLQTYAWLRQALEAGHRPTLAAAVKQTRELLVHVLISEGCLQEARAVAIEHFLSPPRRFRPVAGRLSLFLRLLFSRPSRGMLPAAQRAAGPGPRA